MNFVRKNIGLGLIFLGVALLVTLHLLHFTTVNALLIVPLCLVVGGLVVHVWTIKCQSRY